MNSISSSRNRGQGIYKMTRETFTAGTFPSVAAGEAAPRPTCASHPCTPLLCGPDPIPAHPPTARSCPMPIPARVAQAFTGRRRRAPHAHQTTGVWAGPLPARRLPHFPEGWPRTTCMRSSAPVPRCRALGPVPGLRDLIPGDGVQEASWEHTHVPCVLLSRLMNQHTPYMQHNRR